MLIVISQQNSIHQIGMVEKGLFLVTLRNWQILGTSFHLEDQQQPYMTGKDMQDLLNNLSLRTVMIYGTFLALPSSVFKIIDQPVLIILISCFTSPISVETYTLTHL